MIITVEPIPVVVAEQHNGLARGDPPTALERGERRRVDRGRRLQVEVGEQLEPGEAGLVDAAFTAARLAVVEFGAEHLVTQPNAPTRSRSPRPELQ